MHPFMTNWVHFSRTPDGPPARYKVGKPAGNTKGRNTKHIVIYDYFVMLLPA